MNQAMPDMSNGPILVRCGDTQFGALRIINFEGTSRRAREIPFQISDSNPARKDIDKWDFLIRHCRPRFTVQNWTNIFGNF